MNVITRGVRNAFRNNIRTLSIVLVLGLSIGLALAMLVARASVENKIQSVKGSVGNTITISPAGARGFEGGGEPLTTDQLNKVSSTAHVAAVIQSLSDRLTTSNTNLSSSVQAGSLGRRQANTSGVDVEQAGPPANEQRENSTMRRTFTPPVTITGVTAFTDATYGGSSVRYISGATIDPAKDSDQAVIGKALAEKNSLTTGSTFQAYGKTITVTGVYDAGNNFANNGVFVSLNALQRLSSQPGSVTAATVTVDSIDNVEAATAAIKSSLGDSADVVNNQETAKQAVEPLESVKTISTFSLIGALVAGAIIILLTMVMIVRERRREIGVYKAIGASNLKIMLQFVTEAVTLTLLAMIVGIVIGAAAANPLTSALVNNSSSSAQSQQENVAPRNGVRGIRNNTVTNVRNVHASVGTDILVYGFSAAMIIAVIGSALPALLISRVRPAEVMRAE